ncbi:hypothetical protein [Prosthecobacter sp.]|uniref:hypothetical protein n=1 Tax=Prosthecobacter sp. TaxID=1965333 RepID=UPI00378447BF
MDTPSHKSTSWDQLVRSARSAPAPAEIDMRSAIRAEISALPQPRPVSLLEDVLSLWRSRWLRTGFAAVALAAVLACRESADVLNELAWIWQLQGPVVAGI